MRSKEGQAAYEAYKKEGGLEGGCRLCEAPTLREFEHWRIIPNKFPYDLVAKEHQMLVPKAHASGREVPTEAWDEFQELKYGELAGAYDFYVEATPKKLSIPEHFHLHLIVFQGVK